MEQEFINSDYMNLVEEAAEARGDEKVSRQFIVAAIAEIERGEAKTIKYPFGAPSLKGVYELAVKLSGEGK